MTFPMDLTMWRVYSAEQSMPAGQTFETVDEAQTYLWWVQSGGWWRSIFPDAPRILLEINGRGDGFAMQSFARQISETEWLISLHPRMMNANVLLHEIAHCVAPRSFGDLKGIRQGKVTSGRYHAHGEYFRAAFSALADRFKIGVNADELRRAFKHFELGTPDLDALIAARDHSTKVEIALAAMWEEHERQWATNPRNIETKERIAKAHAEHDAETHVTDEPPFGWIPPERWGVWIWLNRRHHQPMLSQKRLAEQISPAVRCSLGDVARLERSNTPPQTALDLQRCLAFVAVMQLDPVWAETHKGLSAGKLTMSRFFGSTGTEISGPTR